MDDKIFIYRSVSIEIADDMIVIEHPLFQWSAPVDNYKSLLSRVFKELEQRIENDVKKYKEIKQ